jgi:hypothetical protein
LLIRQRRKHRHPRRPNWPQTSRQTAKSCFEIAHKIWELWIAGPHIDHCLLAAPQLISSHLSSMAIFVSVLALSSVSCVGLRRQITFVSDDHIENCEGNRCLGGFRAQTGVSDIYISPFSFKYFGLSFLSKAAVRQDKTESRKVRFQRLAGNLPPGNGQKKSSG